MPNLPPRRCTAPRCTAFVVKGSRCKDHEVKHGWQAPSKDKQKAYGHAWRKRRTRVMRRDAYLCQPCKRLGRNTQGTEVDHIVGRADGGTDDDDNLQTICNTCHKEKTLRER